MKVNGKHIEGYDEPNRCFINVGRLVKDYGGSVVMGWLVNSMDDIEIGIHHCVWRQPDGEIVDVSPQYDKAISQVMNEPVATLPSMVEFEPDPDATLVDGMTRPARYLAKEPKYVKFAEFMTRSDKAYLRGDVTGANYWTERADKERCRAHGDRYHETLDRYDADTKIGTALREDLLEYFTEVNLAC